MYKTALLIIITTLFLLDTAFAGLSFVKKTRLITKDSDNVVLQQKYFSEGDMLRVEEESSGIEGNPGIKIYDFKKKKLYTIMLNVKLYLEQDFMAEKDVVMFEPSPEKKYIIGKGLKVEKTKKGENTIEGRITTVSEVKVVRKAEKGKEKEEQVLEKYLLWEAGELDGIPVKYEFELSGESKKIIEYVDIKTDPIDPALFSIPDGYMAISPF
ncbi:MAG: hypothetical protein AABY66_00170 [Nitrospirota bacterium]